MGRLSAIDMVNVNGVNDSTLRWHLSFNHYPPLPEVCIKLAKRAIKKYNDGRANSNISLRGTGISYRGKLLVSVRDCISSWHLEDFITNNDTEELY